MAQSVETLLCIRISWAERFQMGRVLVSSLTYSGLYRLERDADNNQAPYYIVASGKRLSTIKQLVHRTQFGKPFPKWTEPYDQHGNQLVRPCRPVPTELEYEPWLPEDDTELPWLEAVHKLESVGYRINQEILQWVIETDKKKTTRIIPKQWDEYPKKRKALDRRYEKEGIADLRKKIDFKVKGKKETKRGGKKYHRLTDPEKDTWFNYWHDHFSVEEKKERIESRRKSFDRELNQAQFLSGQTFYQRVSVDYRGRFYLPDFSYQGSDFCRAIIEFASGSVVTDDGWWHLQRHIANMSGESGDVQAKSEVALAESVPHIEIALDPIGNLKEWRAVDKPFCYLRACVELRDESTARFKHWKQTSNRFNEAPKEHQDWVNKLLIRFDDLELIDTANDGKKFLSHLPVEVDQSNSAFQHIAGMMDNDKLRQQSNMYGDTYTDLYLDVAEKLDIPAELGEKRKIVKRVAVPWGYGAKPFTCSDGLKKYRTELEERLPYLSGEPNDEVERISDSVVALLNKEFKVCVDYFERVKDAVNVCRDREGQDVVTWFTPSFFIVRQRVHRARSIKGRVWSGEKDVELKAKQPTPSIDWERNRTKAPPNLVHSYDSALIHGVLSYGRFGSVWAEGLLPYMEPTDEEKHSIHYPVITIHDAFSCHASNCQDLVDKLVLGLGALYSGFDPLNMFLSMTEGTEFDLRKIDSHWVNRSRNAYT